MMPVESTRVPIPRYHASVLAALLALVACRPNTIVSDCESECSIVVYECENAPMTEVVMEACTDECLTDLEEYEESGRKCARAYRSMMACVGTLTSCDEVRTWGFRRSGNLCAEESAKFDDVCKKD